MVGVLCVMWIQVEKRHAAERKDIATQFAKVLEANTLALYKAAEAYAAWANHHCHCADAEGCNAPAQRRRGTRDDESGY